MALRSASCLNVEVGHVPYNGLFVELVVRYKANAVDQQLFQDAVPYGAKVDPFGHRSARLYSHLTAENVPIQELDHVADFRDACSSRVQKRHIFNVEVGERGFAHVLDIDDLHGRVKTHIDHHVHHPSTMNEL